MGDCGAGVWSAAGGLECNDSARVNLRGGMNFTNWRRAAVALTAALAVFAVVVMVSVDGGEQGNSEGAEEVSRLSIPCIFWGPCKQPKPEAEARWRKEAKKREKAGVPCLLGGNCHLPRASAKARWQDDKHKTKMAKLKAKKELAEKEGLKVPASVKKEQKKLREKKSHMYVTPRSIQQGGRKGLLKSIMQRAKSVKKQTHLIKIGQYTSGGKVHPGLLHNGKATLHTFKLYPKSQIALTGVLTALAKAEKAKKQAVMKEAHAMALQKAAKQRFSKADKKAVGVKAVLAKAKADEKANKFEKEQMRLAKRQMRHVKRKYRVAKAALQHPAGADSKINRDLASLQNTKEAERSEEIEAIAREEAQEEGEESGMWTDEAHGVEPHRYHRYHRYEASSAQPYGYHRYEASSAQPYDYLQEEYQEEPRESAIARPHAYQHVLYAADELQQRYVKDQQDFAKAKQRTEAQAERLAALLEHAGSPVDEAKEIQASLRMP